MLELDSKVARSYCQFESLLTTEVCCHPNLQFFESEFLQENELRIFG